MWKIARESSKIRERLEVGSQGPLSHLSVKQYSGKTRSDIYKIYGLSSNIFWKPILQNVALKFLHMEFLWHDNHSNANGILKVNLPSGFICKPFFCQFQAYSQILMSNFWCCSQQPATICIILKAKFDRLHGSIITVNEKFCVYFWDTVAWPLIVYSSGMHCQKWSLQIMLKI